MAFEAGNRAAAGGARAGAGRKPDPLKALLQELLDKAVDAEAWGEIFKVLACRAQAGDIKAAGMLLDRKFGRAPQTIEIEGGESEHTLDIGRLSDEELDRLGCLLRKAAGVDGDGGAAPDA
jgi:hypothetical protein